MDIDQAIAHAKRGQALLFLGAGFSCGAKNMRTEPDPFIPNAADFATHLTTLLGSSSIYPLQTISQYYAQKEGDHGLIRELINTFTVTEVQNYHLIISEQPWIRVYTTNYDSCFEFSALKRGHTWTPRTLDSPITAERNLCVHVNGHISNLTVDSLNSQIKLAHSSYSADSFADSPWSQQLRQDANSAKAIVFVGYSMFDLDISRIFFSSPELQARTMFVVAPTDDDIVISPLETYGTVHRIGIEAFANSFPDTEISPDPAPHEYTWLTPFPSSIEPRAPDDVAAIELVTKDTVDAAMVAWSLGQPDPIYCIRREQIDQTIKLIEGGRRWILIHSDLGNGKSIFKEQLSFVLTSLGYSVFWDTDYDQHKSADLRALSRESGNCVLFLDQSSERFESISGILEVNLSNIVVIVCVRTTLYELGESRYSEHLPSDYVTIDLNRLATDEACCFVRLMNRLGLWGERASLTDAEKLSFISVDCSGAISRLILSVFEDSEIGRRLRFAAGSLLNSKNELSAVIIASFLLNRLERIPQPAILSDILNKDVWRLMKTSQFEMAAEFVRFDLGRVQIRSSIVSQYLLRNAIRPEILIWHIENYVRRLATIRRSNALHHVFTQLMRFPVLESLIDSSRKREIIIGYFQSIKDLRFCEKSALFWLHYAMARLSFGEFDVATLYFEQAKELARGSPRDVRDVNNHYARLLLDSRIKGETYNDYYKAFDMAHSILISQMNRDSNRHYPYRQAKKYVEYISFRGSEFSPSEISSFKSACEQIKAAIGNIRGSLRNSGDVRGCERQMDRAIEIASEM